MPFFLTLQFKLSDLGLSEHARDKMIQLARHRYKADTDTIRLVAVRSVMPSVLPDVQLPHHVLTLQVPHKSPEL